MEGERGERRDPVRATAQRCSAVDAMRTESKYLEK
jgi:hypothetical protein